ncbi:MAG: hypothetical protein ACK4NM_18505 [Hydrogenophaga sp.]
MVPTKAGAKQLQEKIFAVASASARAKRRAASVLNTAITGAASAIVNASAAGMCAAFDDSNRPTPHCRDVPQSLRRSCFRALKVHLVVAVAVAVAVAEAEAEAAVKARLLQPLGNSPSAFAPPSSSLRRWTANKPWSPAHALIP